MSIAALKDGGHGFEIFLGTISFSSNSEFWGGCWLVVVVVQVVIMWQ